MPARGRVHRRRDRQAAGSRRFTPCTGRVGVPARAARLGVVVLPLAELAVGIALVFVPTASGRRACCCCSRSARVWHAEIWRGEAPDCHCFRQSLPSQPDARRSSVMRCSPPPRLLRRGRARSEPRGRPRESARRPDRVGGDVGAGRRARGRGRTALGRQPTSAGGPERRAGRRGASGPAPRRARARVRARRSQGTAGSLTELSETARPTVLVFVSTGCGPCMTLLPSLAHWQDALSGSVTVAAIFEGARAGSRARQRRARAEPRAGADGREAFELYALRATPSAVLITGDGAIAGAPAEGVTAIEALVRTAAAESRPSSSSSNADNRFPRRLAEPTRAG